LARVDGDDAAAGAWFCIPTIDGDAIAATNADRSAGAGRGAAARASTQVAVVAGILARARSAATLKRKKSTAHQQASAKGEEKALWHADRSIWVTGLNTQATVEIGHPFSPRLRFRGGDRQ
jgi:glycerol-3-phosphate acyltransferase PlsY